MSSKDEPSDGLDRRTFMKAAGLTAAAGLAATGASGTAAAHDGFHRPFANPRVWELSKVWEQGYRGRIDRAVGVGDTGCDARHPDLAWNDIRIVEGDDELFLQEVVEFDPEDEQVGELNDGEGFSGTLGPGVADAGETQRETHELDVPGEATEVDVTATWTPQRQDNELLLLDENGNQVASSTDFNPLSGEGERLRGPVEPGYAVAVETYANVSATYEITGTYLTNGTVLERKDEEFDPLPSEVTPETPNLVGWKGGTLARDGDGHGSHTTSTSAGTGQGCAIDESALVEEEPRAILLPGDVIEYEVTPEAGNPDSRDDGGVFASVYGDNVEVEIEDPDGRTVETAIVRAGTTENDASLHGDVTVADAYAHEPGTYTVYIRPSQTEFDAPSTTARVERVAVGPLKPPSETTGERTGEDTTLHAGTAPNASLVAIQGLGNSLSAFSEYPEFFTETFGLRTANFSYGGLQTERLGLSDTYVFVEKMARGGILTVSSAGNFGPLTGSTGPSGADDAIAVAATGPMDGLTSYTSGGTVVRSEDGEIHRKPDVTAPGGLATDTVNAVEAGDPDSDDPVRDYVGFAGTSMAAPYTNGVAGLVAQAMEEDAPDTFELPIPEETEYDDVLRLKGVLLATATETAFTAAPYHRGHTPTYDFGGRDPYEGFGRVNPDTAIEAVTRELSGTSRETVGLNRHADARAVAGYVGGSGEPATYDVSVEFSHLSGGNKGMVKGDPHVDVYVYDAENPTENGDPNVVARAMGRDGSASLSFSAVEEDDDGTVREGTYFVVAKLVNVPGVVNGYDVQAHLELTVERTDQLIVSGTRTDDGSVFTGGQTNEVELAVDADDPVEIREAVPAEWTVLTAYSDDVARVERRENVQYVYFTGGPAASHDVQYLVEAPSGPQQTGSYQFGPVEARTADGEWVSVAGTGSTEYVVGQST